jgi:septal ring factor EnvC (AmiA/AmiB activator)
MNEKLEGTMMGLLGALGVGMYGMYANAKDHQPKTLEEWKSECEKWSEQTRMAHTAMLHLGMALGDAKGECAKLEEKIRVTGIQTDRTIREIQERAEKAQAELSALKAYVAKIEDEKLQAGTPPL